MSAAVLARKPTIIDLDSEDEDASFLDALDEVERVACSPRRPIASGSSRTLSASPAPCHILQPTVAAKTRIIVPAKRRLVAHASDIIDLTGNASSQETIVAGPYTTKRAKKPSTSPAPESSRKGKEREKSAAPIIEVDLEDDFTCGICMELLLGPVMTSCGHNTCAECLKACFVKNKDICPTCRQPTTSANRNLLVESVVEKYHEAMMKKLELAGNHDEARLGRKERAAKLKALQIARMAEAARRKTSPGRRRIVLPHGGIGRGGQHGLPGWFHAAVGGGNVFGVGGAGVAFVPGGHAYNAADYGF